MKAEPLDFFSMLKDEDRISAIDFEFCRFLCQTEPGVDRTVLAAACLASLAYRRGDVCILLDEYAGAVLFDELEVPAGDRLKAPDLNGWLNRLNASTIAGRPGDFKPLIFDDANRLYLHKLWTFEQNLIRHILAKAAASAPGVDEVLLKDGLDRLFGDDDVGPIDWQKVAAIAAVHNLFTVISGGPGTGKTTTVVRMLALLLEQARTNDSVPSIAMAAPTGKAAARLQASVSDAKSSLKTDEAIKEAIPSGGVTLHQLLGARRHTSQFRYNRDNPLPYDCIVVDEASMVDQALMNRLMEAIPERTRLLLLGDKDQLASVEAGSVLGNICGETGQKIFSAAMQQKLGRAGVELPDEYTASEAKPLTDHVVLLQKSYRFREESGIGRLVHAVNKGDAEEAWDVLQDEHYPEVKALSFSSYGSFEDRLFKQIRKQAELCRSSDDPKEMLQILGRLKILAAHRRGPWGVATINRRMEQMLQQEGLISPYKKWYEGRPVIINTNDYALGLSNGDLGVCVRSADESLTVGFDRDDGMVFLRPSRLPDHSAAFALTVHKSQGSEFEEIMLVLPEKSSKILSRELLYTALSRARNGVTVMGREEIFKKIIDHKIRRRSGLGDYLW